MSGPIAPAFARVAVLLLLVCCVSSCGRRKQTDEATLPLPVPEGAIFQPTSDLQTLAYPTHQTRLTSDNLAEVYQTTASGKPESGTYGSVRTGQYGKLLLPRFHEGVDIAALSRDAKGRPLDDVFAAAYGRVALVHKVAGNSDYGIYVVLIHNDPVGTFYTLYGHMAEADAALREGMIVEPGTRLGRMGNTSTSGIPMNRAHLHFEVGMLANDRFLSWPGLPKTHTPGGLYNGQNLWGLNPISLFRDYQDHDGKLTLLEHIRRVPVAIELISKTNKLPDYFRRHPALWSGPDSFEGALVFSISEGGVILSGRPVTAEEAHQLDRNKSAVLRVDEAVLGRNARRIVVKQNGQWKIGGNGEKWLSLMLY